jgi:hypothetical protein
MRRIVSSILTLSVFLLLQYGNIATYYFCKWQAEQQQPLEDCGCEIHLESVFGSHQSHDGITAPTIQLQVIDYTVPVNEIQISTSPLISIAMRSSYNDVLLDGYTSIPYHPPVM